MATAAVYLSTDQVGRRSFNFMSDRYQAYQEERERFSSFMPHGTRGGMIMNSGVAIVGFIVFAGYAIPDTLWAHNHVPDRPEGEERSMPVERAEFTGPVLSSGDASQRTEQPPWNWFNLTHTDPHYLPGIEPHHPASYRNFQAPDGAALMFGWTFDRP